MYDLVFIKEEIEKAVRVGGEIVISAKNVEAQAKSSKRDLVTKYDREVQKTLVEILSEKFPNAGYVGEENEMREHLEAPLVFIIDPIDGTANFTKGMCYSCISVAALVDGVPSVGVVYNPYLDEMFSAVKGQGATLNEEPIRVTDDSLSESIVIFGTSPYNAELTDLTFDRLRRVFNKCLDVRRTGSAALDLCYAAAGRCGVFFEAILALWDYAAGVLIVEEAGGVCVTLEGKRHDYKTVKASMIAGPRKNVEKLMRLFE